MTIVLVPQIEAESSAVQAVLLRWCYVPQRGKAWWETKRKRWVSTLGVLLRHNLQVEDLGLGQPHTCFSEAFMKWSGQSALHHSWIQAGNFISRCRANPKQGQVEHPDLVEFMDGILWKVHTASVFRMKSRHVRVRLLVTCSSKLGSTVKEISRQGYFSLNIDILGHFLHTFVKWLHSPASGSASISLCHYTFK